MKTCETSPEQSSLTLDTSTSSAEASPVRTSASPDAERASRASARAYGQSMPVSLASFDPVSSLWKTSQLSLAGDLEPFSETWPRSGMMRSGTAYRLPPLVPATEEIASGLLPTPTASSYGTCQGGAAGRTGPVRPSLQTMAAKDLWPTPTASLGTNAGLVSPAKAREGGTLVEAVSARMWPTPAARDYRHPNSKPFSERGGGTKGEQLPNAAGGPLNPTWVEGLMGFPSGWTDVSGEG